MTIADLLAGFDKGIELPTTNVVKNYIGGDVLVEDFPKEKTARKQYGVVLSCFVSYHDDNFKSLYRSKPLELWLISNLNTSTITIQTFPSPLGRYVSPDKPSRYGRQHSEMLYTVSM
jgi:hypothetical protein